jgi:hypothetical protein
MGNASPQQRYRTVALFAQTGAEATNWGRPAGSLIL